MPSRTTSGLLFAACILLVAPELRAATPSSHADSSSPTPQGASSYTMPWITLDGGGGPLTMPARRLDASIGQADANRGSALRGGDYELRPGYWTPQTAADAPLLADGFESD